MGIMPPSIQLIPMTVKAVFKIELPPFSDILSQIRRILSHRALKGQEVERFIKHLHRRGRGRMDSTEFHRGLKTRFDIIVRQIPEEERYDDKDYRPENLFTWVS